MAAENGVPIGNILLYLVVVVAPVAGCWLLWTLSRLGREWSRRRRQPEPSGLPIERLSADLRRVHRSLTELAPDAPALRRKATSQAYDALLAQACAAVRVEHRLDTVPEGLEREIERLRVEEALREAGLGIP
jgi:hypothetical protein